MLTREKEQVTGKGKTPFSDAIEAASDLLALSEQLNEDNK